MTQGPAPRPLRSFALDNISTRQGRAQGLATLAGLVAGFGMLIGLIMALHATRIPCPNGTISSGNSPPKCFAHHHAGEGTAIVVICAVLILLAVLATVIVDAITDTLTQVRLSTSKLQEQIGQERD